MSERMLRTLRVDIVFLDMSQDMVELTVPEKTTDAEITSTLSTHNGERVEHGDPHERRAPKHGMDVATCRAGHHVGRFTVCPIDADFKKID